VPPYLRTGAALVLVLLACPLTATESDDAAPADERESPTLRDPLPPVAPPDAPPPAGELSDEVPPPPPLLPPPSP
jgi:hypothetical protein